MHTIRRITCGLAMAAALGSLASAQGVSSPSAAQVESLTMEVDGLSRNYLLYRPEGLKKGAPLVFVIHGFTDTARNMMGSTRMNKVADAKGFAVCYPQGSKDSQGRNFWEVGYAFSEGLGRDDVKFLTQLARHLQESYGLDPRRTFATGMSNGAEMCVMLGLFAPDTFRAIAPVSACVMDKTWVTVKEAPKIPAFFICGDADRTTNWNGDMVNKEGWGAYHPVADMITLFTRNDPGLVKKTKNLADKNKTDGSTIVADYYVNKSSGREVWFYHVVGGGHDWIGRSGNKDIDASEEIWKFFSRYMK